jgi:phosphatidylglycerophosphate synthase
MTQATSANISQEIETDPPALLERAPESHSAKATEETAALAELMTDPLNALYRYSAARALLPLAMKTPVTPNQITYFHIAVGFAAGVSAAQGTRTGLLLAFVLSEIRMILDCLDGVVARAKNMCSPLGRTLDTLSDAVSFVFLEIGICIYMLHTAPQFPAERTLVAVLALGALVAPAHNFYQRKFGAALKGGTDTIAKDLIAITQKVEKGEGGFVARFGLAFDWATASVLAPGSVRELRAEVARATSTVDAGPARPSADVAYILENARSPKLRAALRMVSIVSGDNLIGILNFSLLTGYVAVCQSVAIAFGAVVFTMGALVCGSFLRGSRRAQLNA